MPHQLLKMILFLLLVILFFGKGMTQEAPVRIEDATVFKNGDWKAGRTLILREGRILKMDKGLPEASAKRTVDAEGQFLLPPVVNAHVHLWKPHALQKALGYGIFALLDMHTTDKMAQRMRAHNDSLHYASFYSSNAGATVPDGHGTQFGIEVPTIDSSTDPETFVMDRIEAGADYIKILREPSMPTIDFAQTERIIEVAHREDKQVIAHVSRKDDAVKLVKQGVDGLAHVWSDEHIKEDELKRMVDSDVFVIPTLLVIKKMMERRGEGEMADRMSFEEVQKEVLRLHRAGVPILTGTDPPNAGINYTDDLFEEMRLLHEAGLSKKEVLRASTGNVHKAFEALPPYGLRSEKRASFLLLEEKPDTSFELTNDLVRIYKQGKVLDPGALRPKASRKASPKASQKTSQKGKLGATSLEVIVDSLRSDKGRVLLELRNGDQKKLTSKMAPIKDRRCEVLFTGLGKGAYAVNVIHDENGNGKFDMNDNYIPQEGWGYSNNVEAERGRPPFSERLVDVKVDTTIRIHTDYYEE